MRPRISSKHLASVFSTVGHVSGPVSLLECFAPAVSPAFSFRNRQTISRVEVSRTYATEAPKKQTVLNARSSSHQASEDISSLESSSSAAKTNWVAQLDHYLPLSLRSKSWVQNLAEFDGVKSAQTLPKLLKNARPFFFQGLLGHIAINEGRGDALLWLVNAILSLQRPDGSRPLEKLQADSPWPGSKSLTSLTNDYVDLKECEVDPDQGPRPATTPVFVGDDLFVQADAGFEFHGALGQIWQCLGHMVLESECLATENSVQRMLYVHQILAMMHTQGVVSPVIYDYQSDNVPLIRRKPPILHLTSSRIMTVLSDSTWKASEGEILRDSSYVAASYKLKGQEMPGSEFVPQVRSLGPEIWLEFVLWSCLHGDHFIEAMSIIRHMVATNKWKASTWEKVQSIATKKRESPIDQAQTSSRLRWLASAFEGYSKEPPLIEFPPYTISREAIAALLDGYISAYDTPEDIKSTRRFLGNIEMCKKLLGRKDHGRAADQLFWNSVIFRSTQLLLLEPTAGLYALGGTLNLAHASFFDAGPTISDRSSQDTAVADFANSLASPTFGIMLWALHEYIVTRNVKNAVRVFRWLQKSRMRRLAQPNKPLTSDQASRGAYPDLDQGELSFIDESWHDIPWATVAAFLELLTAEKVYDVARSLIYLPSSDKICLSAKVLSSDIFQPALLQFATATRNLPLVTEVAKHFDIGRIKISEDLAQNLLSCNLMFRKWAFCSTLLNYMKDQSYWLRAEDIMLLALQVLLLDHETKSSGDLSEACNILTAILNSEYAPRPVPGSKVDYSPYRQINQIRRMLATIPGVLLNTACTSVVNTGPAHSITIIPTDAFNILLEGVVETLGAVQGKQVFDRWCDFSTAEGQDLVEFRETHHIEGEKFRGQRVTLRTEGYEKVVSPNVRTISIILSPALRSLDDFFERKKKPTSIPTKPVEEPAQQEKSLLSQSDAKEPLQLKWTDDNDIWYVHQGQAKEMQELCVLPYDAPSRDNLEWGIRSYRALGLNYKEISDLIPGAIAAPVESTTELETVDEPGLQSRKSRVRREALKGLVKI